jgi:hypothetical protein
VQNPIQTPFIEYEPDNKMRASSIKPDRFCRFEESGTDAGVIANHLV